MRKRLIGKAFAIAMSGAMVLTATPVTANIFNVAHIVKAADEQSVKTNLRRLHIFSFVVYCIRQILRRRKWKRPCGTD